MSVSKNAHILAIDSALNELRELCEDCVLGFPLIEDLLKHIPLFVFLRLLPVSLTLVGDLQRVVRCHVDDAASLFGGSNSAVDSDVSFDLLKIIVQFLFQSKHLLVLRFILIEYFQQSANLSILVFNFVFGSFELACLRSELLFNLVAFSLLKG